MANNIGWLWRKMVRGMSANLLRRQALNPAALQGRRGEEAAYWYLRDRGFIMVDRNYRAAGFRGEIDLIGWDGDTLVFVEVKTRGPQPLLLPEAAVDSGKERLVVAAAEEYRRRSHRLAAPYRFDIVSVVAAPSGDKIEHFRDAFRPRATPLL
ncbi:MAG: YraN family protein [Acidobacteria bacterium]|nr:YraN family protein [Acidobacteriota bacterium]